MEVVFNKVTAVKNKTIIKDLDLEIKENQINGVCGTNGKSLIGKLIYALDDITSGQIKVGDYVLNKRKNKKNIKSLRFYVGYLISDPKDFFSKITVKEEVEFGLKYYKYKLDQKESRTIDALKMVGLDDSYLNRNIEELSYSESKKVMLAAALVYNPKILILDEFEKGLTRKDKKEIKKLLKILKRKFQKTIIIITNDIEFMFDLCDFVFVIKNGTLVLEGDKTKFFDIELYKYVEMPKIVEFIEYAKDRGKGIGNYTDAKDLLKAIYRSAK